jgi:hypothetical protein
MAIVHCKKIKAEFGPRRLDSIRPSEIKSWMVKLKAEGYAQIRSALADGAALQRRHG